MNPEKNLSNKDLALLLLRHLATVYGLSGVSLGRSKESRLLEASIRLLVLDFDGDFDSFLIDDLLSEAKKRNYDGNTNRRPMDIFSDDLEFASPVVLAQLLLQDLRRVYHRTPWDQRLAGEDNIYQAVKLLNIDESASEYDFSTADIIYVSGERYYLRLKNEPVIPYIA